MAFVSENEAVVGPPGGALGFDLTHRTSQSGKKSEKRSPGADGGRESERNLKTDAIFSYIRGYQPQERVVERDHSRAL